MGRLHRPRDPLSHYRSLGGHPSAPVKALAVKAAAHNVRRRGVVPTWSGGLVLLLHCFAVAFHELSLSASPYVSFVFECEHYAPTAGAVLLLDMNFVSQSPYQKIRSF